MILSLTTLEEFVHIRFQVVNFSRGAHQGSKPLLYVFLIINQIKIANPLQLICKITFYLLICPFRALIESTQCVVSIIKLVRKALILTPSTLNFNPLITSSFFGLLDHELTSIYVVKWLRCDYYGNLKTWAI